MPQPNGGNTPSIHEPVLDPRAERGWTLAGLILLLSLSAVLVAWTQARQQVTARAVESFTESAEEMGHCVRLRMSAFEQVVRSGQGLFAASDRVESAAWRSYVRSQQLEEYFSGVLSLGFAPWVPVDRLDSLFEAARREHRGAFHISPVGERPFYVPVFYAEPGLLSDAPPVGFDLYSDPIRRVAMDQARDSGEVTLSAEVRMPAQDGRAAVVLYAPVYRREPVSLEARSEHLMGFVFAPLDVMRFMDDVLQREFPQLRVQVLDGSGWVSRIYDSHPHAEGHDPKFSRSVPVHLAGREWLLQVSSLPSFEAAIDRTAEAMILGSGALISGLLFAITLSLASTRKRAVHLARRYTRQLEDERRRMVEIGATLGEGIWVQDTRDRILSVNPAAAQLLGWSEQELIGMEGGKLLSDAARASGIGSHHHAVERARREDGTRFAAEETEFRRKDGGALPVSVVSTPILRNGNVVGSVVAFQDLRGRKAAEEALRASERFKALFDYSSEALFLVETSGIIVDVNRLACDRLGYAREELIGQRPSLFVRWPSLPGAGESFEQLFTELEGAETVAAEGEHVRKDGTRYPVEGSFSAITYGGQHRVLIAARDISQRKEAERSVAQALATVEQSRAEVEDINRRLAESNRELQRLSRRDALTGVANRRYFDEYLELEWRRAERDARPLSLLLADVDHFKPFNDFYGHQAGDDCLRRIAQTLDGQLSRSIDVAARYGGEEFVVILPETPLTGAQNIAERMRSAVQGMRVRHEPSDVSEFVTVSIGVASVIPHRGDSKEQLIGAADRALYAAKQAGRNRIYPPLPVSR